MENMTAEKAVDAFEKGMLKKHKTHPLIVSRQNVPKWFDGLHPKTLANLESQGKGPKSFKKGRLRFYLFEDLLNFITKG